MNNTRKTFNLKSTNDFSSTSSQWLYACLGLVLSINAFAYFKPGGFISNGLGVLFLLIGIALLIYGLLSIGRSSRYSLRVVIDDVAVAYRNQFQSPVCEIRWSEIQSIEIERSKIAIESNEVKHVLEYKASADVSLDFKKYFKEMAIRKSIPVN